MSRTFITTDIIYAAQAQRPQGGNLYVGCNATVTHAARDLAYTYGFTIVYAESPTKNFTGAGYVLGFDECRGENGCSTVHSGTPAKELTETPAAITNTVQTVAPDLSQEDIQAVISAVQIVLETINRQ